MAAELDGSNTIRPLDLGIDGRPELLFLPSVDLATGRLTGFEALVRWDDPTQGLISPDELIPWAEANGHMTALNEWVLSEACAAAVTWGSEIQVAVNCSARQLRRHEVAVAATAALSSSGLAPHRLTIEVTDRALADDDALVDLRAISLMGIQLSVDDLRSDWWALGKLPLFAVTTTRPLAVNTMKIDGSLIVGIDESGSANRTIVETIVKVTHSLDLRTVAESVETEGQVAVLREIGVDAAQGYFFAAPLAADEATALTRLELPFFPLSDSHAKHLRRPDPSGRAEAASSS
ncbi:MAG TPA: EAL domain-containing protein [Acidimicrobiales bacterium]